MSVEPSLDQIRTVADNVQVHKFGGSSLADAFCYRRVARIVTEYAGASDVVVVSAAGDTTNRILAIIKAQRESGDTADILLDQLERFQQGLITELLGTEFASPLLEQSTIDFQRFRDFVSGEEHIEHEAELLSYGELWSARLLAALLRKQGTKAEHIDARDFLKAEDAPEPIIQELESRHNLLNRVAPFPGTRFIVTGFIARGLQGESLTLGRNGSDYSATLVGSLLNSKQVTIWKDVAGVYSADPRKIERVVSLPTLDWSEAEELARLGSPVLHPRTFQPVDRDRMVISVRSSLKVENQQTRIGNFEHTEPKGKVFTSLSEVVLFKVELNDRELVKQLEALDLTPLVSWTEPEKHQQYLVFHQNHLNYISQWLERIKAGNAVTQIHGYSMVALVGNRIQETDQYNTFKLQLDDQQVRRFAVSEDGCSAVAILEQKLDNRLLNRLHSQLFNYRRSLGVLVIGRGNIGTAWLDLFRQQRDRINQVMDVRVIGIANSKKLWLDYSGVELNDWQAGFDRLSRPYVLTELLRELPNAPYDELVMIDLTDAKPVAQLYPSLFANGLHIISANKRAGSAEESLYREIRTIQHEYKREWLYNTTVGAGLPLNYAINDLRGSGDEIRSISGIFSGTMSWLFENFTDGVKFSDLVLEAKKRGYSEPDPREDLSCQDLVRKLLILAREIGLNLDWEDISVSSLVPESLRDISASEFLERAEELDEPMDHMLKEAAKEGNVPRLLASFSVSEEGRVSAKIGVEYIPAGDMLANLIPGENIFVIYTDWYSEMPLVISGPGAGKHVTAGGVQSDLNQLLAKLTVTG
ncbi:aspartate kinase /homoserine dehydrogenase [Idiomarina fontislapidosi]|uniref:Bifunctional aspartokinase/homoserine dehydrogenase n=1 Tax=Idiomarina fontislapidosi TaxID=263723 RepID=A0A432XSS9_9GAMM|nr:bifunctional aspartate kinase/homoserine dehydrogenase II [Idiomarina fontislapidosi]PYE31326.1 aspartate kinase /homoserine dehydrogenase [Idiomarina fontislapidosi]RUO51713.1 bifunctional aspartate kinase/homoserine dehydrogenase II [Idiomarina fontislapidosi]|tara:strand:+ start:111 stop:2549 length:2439 start_codon:yes stop_codon:yes gene_type:complete